jgi:hypothetical protein
MAEELGGSDDPVEVLRRWEGSGGIWRVVRRTPIELEIVLLTCNAGEEMGRVTSSDPALAVFVAGRDGSDG